MTHTFKRVKDSLVALLQDRDYKVIALTGKWGTGKTYLWQSVADDQFGKKKASEQPIYVSLFGARTINELKLRILQNTYLKDASIVKKLIKTSGGILAGAINRFVGFSAENAALIWLPQLTKGRLIVTGPPPWATALPAASIVARAGTTGGKERRFPPTVVTTGF